VKEANRAQAKKEYNASHTKASADPGPRGPPELQTPFRDVLNWDKETVQSLDVCSPPHPNENMLLSEKAIVYTGHPQSGLSFPGHT
jgi:hypothetical protein